MFILKVQRTLLSYRDWKHQKQDFSWFVTYVIGDWVFLSAPQIDRTLYVPRFQHKSITGITRDVMGDLSTIRTDYLQHQSQVTAINTTAFGRFVTQLSSRWTDYFAMKWAAFASKLEGPGSTKQHRASSLVVGIRYSLLQRGTTEGTTTTTHPGTWSVLLRDPVPSFMQEEVPARLQHLEETRQYADCSSRGRLSGAQRSRICPHNLLRETEWKARPGSLRNET